MNGEWDEAERALNSLLPIMEEANTNVTVRRLYLLIVINNQRKPKTKLFSFKLYYNRTEHEILDPRAEVPGKFRGREDP